MTEPSQDAVVLEKEDSELSTGLHNGSNEMYLGSPINNLKSSLNLASSSDDEAPRKRIIKRVKRLSDSDSDNEISDELTDSEKLDLPKQRLVNIKGNNPSLSKSGLKPSCKHNDRYFSSNASDTDTTELVKTKLQMSNSNNNEVSIRLPHRSRLLNNAMISDSEVSVNDKSILQSINNESDTAILKIKPYSSLKQCKGTLSDSSESGTEKDIRNDEQQLRIKNKRDKLRDKFKNLVTSRGKELSSTNVENGLNKNSDSDSSRASGEEMTSIEKIKQKIKERMSFKSSICDPDTSDEETGPQKPVYKKKKERKKTILTSPKPQRISAKQAMENMQKIKSEANRMLREKEVSLPYHRPKALSLKDIMSRRKLAVSADGKPLPIKMNGEQLRQYAQILDERQKEMMELCKSESEEEIDKINENNDEIDKATAAKEESEPNYNRTCIEKVHNTNNMSDMNTNVNDDSMREVRHEEVTIDKSADKSSKEQDSETSMQLVYNDSANSIVDDKSTADLEEPIDNFSSETRETSTLSLENENFKTSVNPEQTNLILAKDDSKETSVLKERTSISKTDNGGDVGKTVINKLLVQENSTKHDTETDSQLISLHFDSEKSIYENVTESFTINTNKIIEVTETTKCADENNGISEMTDAINIVIHQNKEECAAMEMDKEFSDEDINMADIDNIIENAEIIKDIEDKVNSQFLIRDKPLNLNPKLTGAPGMVIDLDTEAAAPKKSGVELLKERFTYFAKLKTLEEFERERENKIKPGTQLKKLKLELEEKMTEQRSLEWAKRLDDEKQQQKELKVLRGEESDEEDIDKIEAALEGNEAKEEEQNDSSEKSESEPEEEPIENDIEIKDKPRVKNAMLDDEAEESDGVDDENNTQFKANDENEGDDIVEDDIQDDSEENESDSDESSESEEEQTKTKKGRILKAFEDSDEEDSLKTKEVIRVGGEIEAEKRSSESKNDSSVEDKLVESQIDSQDEELQLAQRHKTNSEDLFTSQESNLLASGTKDMGESDEAFTQTFSILESSKEKTAELDFNTQTLKGSDLVGIGEMCPLTESQCNLSLPSQIPTTQPSQSQPIGEDILAMCTGNFYNNQFISQVDATQAPIANSQKYDAFVNLQPQYSKEDKACDSAPAACDDIHINTRTLVAQHIINVIEPKETDFIELNTNKENSICKDDNLKSILDELADPEFDSRKPNKYFPARLDKPEVVKNEVQVKKKFVIESDDELSETEVADSKKQKKIKKKKPEKRALHISDDEEEISEEEENEEYETDIEEENQERLVEYDSEENEIELIKPQNPKKKRKLAEFFENEAELTSEDEWAGSGDEDEAGLDRMEREEGDDETFHQGKLQRELGQIHMRDVLDQDKREVRLIQELLFEDGDLGGGGRQRKFRWQNIDGEEETGSAREPGEFADTPEEEFESEEQWRKQRHERETFLRLMQNKDEPDESLNMTVNRTTIIKANLLSKTMSTLLMEVNPNTEKTEDSVVEKKTARDIPSPKKPFALFQQSYQGSLLSRGRGALARLAALATPLAADDDAEARVATLGPASRRNFVFATLTPNEKEPKVTKRKAESNPNTPKLVKKMRTEDRRSSSKSSLLDHFKL